ncbi:hypothetical protein DOTSEDRAFT_25322 [Dothistroma septosporum NZE10]|uniref:Uncharacterized protein n=1 Tax=Dothistroma septosporum (strain NZE10 / CBS 128990) TaxID=675120 RepID=M2XLS7_DOTSN|nr:hypothetical protein DOTSEDRAFT_25322 [Dothistroma septosporum NZE10]
MDELQLEADFDLKTWQVMLIRIWFAADMCSMPAMANAVGAMLDNATNSDFDYPETACEIWKLAPRGASWRDYIVHRFRQDFRWNVYFPQKLDNIGRLPASLLPPEGNLNSCLSEGDGSYGDIEVALPELQQDK